MRALHTAGHIRAAVLFLCLLTFLLALSVAPLTEASQKTPCYLLKDEGGYLTVYTADGSEKLQRYEVLTRLLPQKDCEDLLSGILVYSDEQLARLVEDYGG